MMYTPLNPYERYELTGMSDEERLEERRQREEEYWSSPHWEDYESEALIDDLEAILDGEF